MPPRARKKSKGNEEGGGVGDDVATFSDEVKVEALVAVKQEQEGNPKENSVEEIQQAEESSMSMLLKEVRSMREEMNEMKGLQERAREETKAGKEEMVNRNEETGAKMESVFEELISMKDELQLKAAARLWCSDKNKAIAQYGHISSWNVSSITNMRILFGKSTEDVSQGNGDWNKDFNEDLSGWDTSNVTNMEFMFYGSESFNSDLSRWNVGNCTNMIGMFQDAKSFKSDLQGWKVEKVTDTSFMFDEAESFTSDLSRWNVGNCTNMSGMFQDAKSFKSDLKGWNIGKVTDMSFMFNRAESFKSDLSRWSTGNCTNMYAMFGKASSFNRGTIKNWDLSSIKGSTVKTVEGKNNYTREQCMPLHFK